MSDEAVRKEFEAWKKSLPKLRDRIVNHPHYPPNELDDTFDIVRDELERAAGIADMWNTSADEKQIAKCIAAAIRKLKE